eukprot:bmy_10857T0
MMGLDQDSYMGKRPRASAAFFCSSTPRSMASSPTRTTRRSAPQLLRQAVRGLGGALGTGHQGPPHLEGQQQDEDRSGHAQDIEPSCHIGDIQACAEAICLWPHQ